MKGIQLDQPNPNNVHCWWLGENLVELSHDLRHLGKVLQMAQIADIADSKELTHDIHLEGNFNGMSTTKGGEEGGGGEFQNFQLLVIP